MLGDVHLRVPNAELWGIGQPFSATAQKSLEFKPTSPLGGSQFTFGRIKERWTEASLNQAIIQAVGNAMLDVGLLPRHAKLGGGERGGGWFRYYIERCNEEETALFATAISEIFGPLDDARYLISRSARFFDDTFLSKLLPEVLAKYVRKERREVVMFYQFTSHLVFSKHKDDAARFEKYWNALVSPGEVLYAHGKGWEKRHGVCESERDGQSNRPARQGRVPLISASLLL